MDFFIWAVYIVILLINLYQIISIGFPQAGLMLIKSAVGIVIIHLIIVLTHHYEVGLYKQLLKQIMPL